MKKNSLSNHDEIDMLQVVKTIWDGKLKIALIIIISILAGFFYNNLTPQLYNNSVVIKPSKNSQFTKFQQISSFLDIYEVKLKPISNINIFNESNAQNHLRISNEYVLDKFVEELLDYKELIFVLNDIEKNKDDISGLSTTNQTQKIFDYAKSLKVNKIKTKPDYLLSFQWDNDKESIEIIDKTIKLTMINFENSFFKDLEDRLEVKKKLFLMRDMNRVDYLKEQNLIARELEISDNQLENIDQANEGYYLRGFEAIEKEISLIQSRKYKDFNDIKKELNFLKQGDFNWINYNSFLIETESNKNLQKTLIIFILIGFLAGVFYIFISNLLESQKVTKK